MVVYICIYSSDGTFVEKSHFWDKTFRLFIGKVSQKHPDYSLFTQDFPQCDFCGIGWRFFNLTYTFWMLFFVDVLPWLNVRVHSIRSDSVVLHPPKAEVRQVCPRYAVLLAENQTNRFPPSLFSSIKDNGICKHVNVIHNSLLLNFCAANIRIIVW